MTPADELASERIEIAVAVVEHDGRFLIGQRSEGTKLAGYWEFPGGKIEPGESAAQAAIRECQEETGLTIRIIGQHSIVEHTYEHGELRLHFLQASCHGPIAPLPARFRWVSADQLPGYTFPAANAALLLELSARTTG